MLSFLGWIPVLGPIFDGIVSMFAKWQDTTLGLAKTKADVDKTEIQASTQTLSDFRDDIGVRLARDLVMFPVSLWVALIVYAKTIELEHPTWVWSVSPLPDSLSFLPYAVLTFLFGVTAMKMYRK